MASFLHDNPQRFLSIVGACAEARGMLPTYVAKDYFITVVLKEINVRNPDIVFKGGTCLSKCYGAINRFSEDIDLGLAEPHATEGMRRKMKSCVVGAAEAVGLSISNLDKTRSRREFNRFVVELPSFGLARSTPLVVETAVMTPVQPTATRKISSFVFDWAEQLGLGDQLSQFSNLEPYEVTATTLERSFADKVFAVCDYYLDGESTMMRQSRHIYDLCKMLSIVRLDDSMANLMNSVRNQRKGRYRCLSAQDGIDLPAVLEEIAAEGAYRNDYLNITAELLYEDVPYETAVSALPAIAAWLRSAVAANNGPAETH